MQQSPGGGVGGNNSCTERRGCNSSCEAGLSKVTFLARRRGRRILDSGLMRKIVWIILFLPSVLFAQFPDKETARQAGIQAQKLAQFYRLLAGTLCRYARLSVGGGGRHTRYAFSTRPSFDIPLPPKEMEEAKVSFDGSFGGIGVEFNVLGDTITVVGVIAGGPAESVGVRPADRIIGVDGRTVVGVKRSDVPALLRGPKGSKVNIEVGP